MEERAHAIKAGAATIGVVVGYLWGEWTVMLKALLILVCIDWLTGWAAAWIHGELRSRKSYIGIAKKVSIFLLVTVAHVIDTVLGEMHYLRDAVVFFYLANELLSICENAGRMGMPMPPVLRNAIEVLESKAGGGKEKGEQKEGDNGAKEQ